MTCHVLVDAPDGGSVKARALLDSASSASFMSERLSQNLSFSRSHQDTRISGVTGLSHKSPLHSVSSFSISPVLNSTKKFNVTAVIVPRVTCDLPLNPVSFDTEWEHLIDLPLADPDFGQPGRVDMFLGIDFFVQISCQDWRIGPPDSLCF